MTRLSLAALIILVGVNAAAAQTIPLFPTQWPQPGSFDGPAIVTQDERGN